MPEKEKANRKVAGRNGADTPESEGEQSAVVTFVVPNNSCGLGEPMFPDGADGASIDQFVVVGGSVAARVRMPMPDADAVAAHLGAHTPWRVDGRFDGVEGETLLTLSLDTAEQFLSELGSGALTVLNVVHDSGEWTFELLFSDYAAVSAFYQNCQDAGLDVTPQTVHDPEESVSNANYGLTPGQRETLLVAFDAGYFDIPRGTDLNALGAEFGVSDSAVSQRLRRGIRSVLERTLWDSERL